MRHACVTKVAVPLLADSEHFDKHLVTQLGYRTPQLLM